jgi:hypothetical protein
MAAGDKTRGAVTPAPIMHGPGNVVRVSSLIGFVQAGPCWWQHGGHDWFRRSSRFLRLVICPK